MESSLKRRGDSDSSTPDVAEDNERITRNLQELVREAESFHSSASTVLGDDARSTVWGGSVLGDPLSDEQYRHIQDWIPPPTIVEEDNQGDQEASRITPSMDPSRAEAANDSDQESDADSDLERQLTKRFQELALTYLEQKDYPRAELFLRKVIDRSTDNDHPADEINTTNLMLASICGLQGKWDDAESILVPIAMAKGTAETMAFHGMHALAMVHLEKSEHDIAVKYCKRAVSGNRKLWGKKSPWYYESMALLAQIYDSKGDSTEAEGCRSFLPDGYNFNIKLQPVEYMENFVVRTIWVPHRKPPLVNTARSESPSTPPTPSEREPSAGSAESLVDNLIGLTTTELDSLTPAEPNIGPVQDAVQQLDLRPRYLQVASQAPQRSAHAVAPENTTFSVSLTHRDQSQTTSVPQILKQKVDTIVQVERSPEPQKTGKLIVGVDFGITHSAIAYAFMTNNEVKEDIVTDWGGNHTKQQVIKYSLVLVIKPLLTLPRCQLSCITISTRRWLAGVPISQTPWDLQDILSQVYKRCSGSSYSSCFLAIHT